MFVRVVQMLKLPMKILKTYNSIAQTNRNLNTTRELYVIHTLISSKKKNCSFIFG